MSTKHRSPALAAAVTLIVNACGMGQDYVENSIKGTAKAYGVDEATAVRFELLNWEGDLSRNEINDALVALGSSYEQTKADLRAADKAREERLDARHQAFATV